MPPAKDPPTKTCQHCGRTYHRKRFKGKLETASQWRNRKGCSSSCARKIAAQEARANRPASHCRICGTHVPRDTRQRQRQTCSPECRNELLARLKTKKAEAIAGNVDHPPCSHCGGDVAQRSGERVSRWLARKTCSEPCRIARLDTGGKGARKAYRATRVRRERTRLARDGYVFDGRFPTPPGVTNWQSVSGPDTGVIAAAPSRGLRSPTTLSALASAVRAHPDLGAALLGQLSDSWVQQDAASGR